jgi:maleylpyruvate isomerase
MVPMTNEREVALGLLPGATARVVRAVDRLDDDAWAEPSHLPGWSRAHVVAHLSLNAEALTRCLHGVVSDGEDAASPTMYDSDDQRDRDIEELAASSPTRIRDRFLAATTTFEDAVTAVPGDRWETHVERTPGGRTMRLGSLPGMRVRELEVHHVDLDAGYSTDDWSEAFSVLLLDAMAKRLQPARRWEIRPLDVDGTWVLGPDDDSPGEGQIVTGPAADIGWWLTGRPASGAVSCSHGELPSIEGW